MEELESKNFSGWTGITFVCSFDENDLVLTEICRRGTAEFRFLATAAKLDFESVQPNDFYASSFASGITNQVVLEYQLLSTAGSNENANKAIFGRLIYLAKYSNAVEDSADALSIRALPRIGALGLWEKTAIGSGPANQLGGAIADSFETYFRDAITHFVTYNKDPIPAR